MFNCLVLGEKKREYKLGLLIPYRKVTPYFQNDYNKGEAFAAAMTIAVERINANPTLLADYNLTFVWKDTECNELLGVREQLNQMISGVQAFIGPRLLLPDGGEKCCGIQYDDDFLREYAIFHVVQFNIGFSTLNDFVLC